MLTVAFGSVLVLGDELGGRAVAGVLLLEGLVAVPLGVCVAVVLSKVRFFGWLNFLGRQTSSIVFLHSYPVLFSTTLAVHTRHAWLSVAPVQRVALTGASVLLALAVYWATRAVPGL